MTGREVATFLRKQGHSQFDSKRANQVLYRLHAASLVDRDASGDKPRWNPSGIWDARPDASATRNRSKRPLSVANPEIKLYLVAKTEVKVLKDQTASPNDHYVNTDWVGTHVVASININHPFWTLRLNGPEDEALYCMFAAVDAYVQWKIAQLHEPPDAYEVMRMRDNALRYCSLAESEQVMNDQRFGA
jgi:hypothetical protein